MDIYTSDDEKGEALKQWLRTNITFIMFFIISAIVVVITGRYWYAEKQEKSQQAAQYYYMVEKPVISQNSAQVTDYADKLMAEYSDTPYAFFTAIKLAQYQASLAEYDKSQQFLVWAKKRTVIPGQNDLVSLKLAVLALEQNRYEEALAILKKRETKGFESLFKELEGDIYVRQSQLGMARDAYDVAYKSAQINRKSIIKLKKDDIAG